jgi:hypothetical protein
LSDECIHGLEGTLCAACFPKAAPEPAVFAAAQTRLRAAAGPRRSAPGRTASGRARTLAGAGPVDDVSEQRIYHVTHVRNLADILVSGALFADESNTWGERPTVDISSPDTRAVRRMTPVAGSGDATVAHFVPFFLSPNATLWQTVRSNQADPRLSAEILGADAADFVILVSTVKTVVDAMPADAVRAMPFVVADGDAGHVLTRFATTREDAERSLRHLRADQDSESPSIAQAELLIEETFPFESVTLIGVAHDKARAAVKKILAESEFATKVAVYPPWFAVAE